ncbi:MAG: tryptophan 7-halogenase, partial [Pseudomonadota bacterium]
MDNPKHIVIAGGGTAGWMAANYFAHKWQSDVVKVTLVESPDIGIIGVGEGSTPTLKRFFHELGIHDSDWMGRCNATYKVSIQFNDWSPASGVDSYRHPFISQTDTLTALTTPSKGAVRTVSRCARRAFSRAVLAASRAAVRA